MTPDLTDLGPGVQSRHPVGGGMSLACPHFLPHSHPAPLTLLLTPGFSCVSLL